MKTTSSPLSESPGRAGLPIHVDALGAKIAELSAHIQAATYRLLVLIREFDQRHGWHNQGARSCAHWLNWRTGLDLGAAREKVRVARALEHLPRISEAMNGGEVSYSKVRAMTRVATPDNEAELLGFAKAGTAAHVERLVRVWRRVDRATECQEARNQRRHRYLRAYTDEDGMLVLRGRLPADVGAAVLKALEAAEEALYQKQKLGRATPEDHSLEDELTPGKRRADALGLLAETALQHGFDSLGDKATAADRYQVVLHLDAEALEEDGETGQAALESGVRVSAETSRRLACDSSKVVMRHDSSDRTLDVGRKTRTVPPSLRRALAHRDRGCRFPGCGLEICDSHHIRHWADGGKTKLDNLLLLCRGHHTAVHEHGFGVRLHPDGTPRFHDPQGRPIPVAPPPPRLPARPTDALRTEHTERGLRSDPLTAFPTWEGKAVDLDMALMYFLPDRPQLETTAPSC